MVEKVKILIDEPVKDGWLGFDQYASSLVNLIMGSMPQFTIGIFGDWGTGKTTLMRMMCEKLKEEDYKENVVPVWFNAWFYEREQHLAIFPLLNTIIADMEKNPDLSKVKDVIDEVRLSLLKKFIKSIKIKAGIVEFSPGDVINEAKELSEAIESEAIYYNEFKYIEKILEMHNKETKKELRIVVFIDDLDRCAPDKVLEVLESIKIFLGIRGFIYVLGLSPAVINNCINKKYVNLGIQGSDYIKKIIQIPFRIPEWREDELIEYAKKVTELLEDPYKKLFSDLEELVIKGLEKNPREVKRFINSYIATQEIFKKEKLNEKNLLLLQIFQFRWPIFYDKIFDFRDEQHLKEFTEDVIKYIEDENFESPLHKEFIDSHIKSKEIQKFLKSKKAQNLFSMLAEMKPEELDKYRRVGKALGETARKETERSMTRQEVLDKINKGESLEGTNLISIYLEGENLINSNFSRANLTWANLSNTNLSGANLSNTNLKKANLKNANLKEANLEDADLNDAKLDNADLTEADLSGTNLSWANLSNTNLSKVKNLSTARNLKKAKHLNKANLSEVDFAEVDFTNLYLSGANLSGVKNLHKARNLSGINLTGADLTGTDLIGVDLKGANLSKANLSNANLTDADLSDANIEGADFSSANLSKVKNLREAKNLSGIKLKGTDLIGVDLKGANLSKADFFNANLTDADLKGANLSEADFCNANLTDADLSEAKLVNADLKNTILKGTDITSADLFKAKFFTIKTEGIKVNNDTKTNDVQLTRWASGESYFKQNKEVLDNLDEGLRKIILRDNPHLIGKKRPTKIFI